VLTWPHSSRNFLRSVAELSKLTARLLSHAKPISSEAGLFSLSEPGQSREQVNQLWGTCLFCHQAPADTLFHALHEFCMDRWTPLLPNEWCCKATSLTRSRLGCPLDTSEPSQPTGGGPRGGRKRPRGTMTSIIPHAAALQAQVDRSTPLLAETVTTGNEWSPPSDRLWYSESSSP
jgi:hypothetical protein